MALIPLTDIKKIDLNGKVEKGLVNKIFVALRDDILTMPPRDGLTLAGAVTISGDIIFKPGKKFFQIDFTRETGELKFSLEGENDSKTDVTTLEISAPTLTPILRGFVQEYKNADLVIVAQETCGDNYLLGDHCQPTQMISSEGTTGKGRSDYKGFVMMFDSVGMAPTYNGVISTTPAL